MAVIRITEYKNRDSIGALEELLVLFKEGKAHGLCFSFKRDEGHHSIGLTGDYFDDPTDVLAVVSRIDFEVNMLLRERNAAE